MKKFFLIVFSFMVIIPSMAQTSQGQMFDLFVNAGLGVSGVTTDDDSEPFEDVDFSYNPGFGLRINDILGPDIFVRVDFGYLEVNWVTQVVAAPYLVWRGKNYMNLDGVIAYRLGNLWVGGGVYIGIGIESWWISEIAGPVGTPGKFDLGLMADAGYDLFDRFYLGLQVRYGLLSQYSYAEIHNFIVYGTLGYKLVSF